MSRVRTASLLIVSCLAAGILIRGPVAAEGDPPVVRSAECRWKTGPIQLDGKLDDAAWSKAQPVQDFAVFWQKRPAKSATRARLLWDDSHLYFGAEMDDVDLFAMEKARNGMTWLDDVFELFFKPAEDKLTYYELQVNPLNTQLELFLPSRGSGGYRRFAPTTRFGMESAVTLQGTLNQPDDKDKGWAVEGRIPWTAFAASGGKPKAGTRWRFALCRYDYSTAFDQPETSSSAPLTRPDFHRYEDYGELLFAGPTK